MSTIVPRYKISQEVFDGLSAQLSKIALDHSLYQWDDYSITFGVYGFSEAPLEFIAFALKEYYFQHYEVYSSYGDADANMYRITLSFTF